MKVNFGTKFLKELKKVEDPKIKKSVLSFIEEVKSTENLARLSKVKKLKGYKNIYRARIGDYRIGLVYKDGILSFETILLRKDIYKRFP